MSDATLDCNGTPEWRNRQTHRFQKPEAGELTAEADGPNYRERLVFAIGLPFLLLAVLWYLAVRFVARCVARFVTDPAEAFSIAALGCISGLAIARWWSGQP